MNQSSNLTYSYNQLLSLTRLKMYLQKFWNIITVSLTCILYVKLLFICLLKQVIHIISCYHWQVQIWLSWNPDLGFAIAFEVLQTFSSRFVWEILCLDYFHCFSIHRHRCFWKRILSGVRLYELRNELSPNPLCCKKKESKLKDLRNLSLKYFFDLV